MDTLPTIYLKTCDKPTAIQLYDFMLRRRLFTKMQCFYLVLLAAVCQGLAVQKVEKELPRPQLLVLTTMDPPSLQVEWEPVKSADSADPVIGYKVKIWEFPPIKIYKFIEVNGIKKLVEEIIPPKIDDAEVPPEEDAKEIVVEDPLGTTAYIPNLKLNLIYEVRVRAFTKHQEGPLSPHMRVQLLGQEEPKSENLDKDIYNVV